MQYLLTTLLAVLAYEICSAPLHIMRNVNAEEYRKKEGKQMNDDEPSMIYLAVKHGWTIVENVTSKMRYVINYDKLNDDIDPVSEKISEETTYNIQRGDTYLYRDLSYDEMVTALNNLVNDPALADDKNKTKPIKAQKRKNAVDELLTHFERP